MNRAGLNVTIRASAYHPIGHVTVIKIAATAAMSWTVMEDSPALTRNAGSRMTGDATTTVTALTEAMRRIVHANMMTSGVVRLTKSNAYQNRGFAMDGWIVELTIRVMRRTVPVMITSMLDVTAPLSVFPNSTFAMVLTIVEILKMKLTAFVTVWNNSVLLVRVFILEVGVTDGLTVQMALTRIIASVIAPI